jgi:hypothetical protein
MRWAGAGNEPRSIESFASEHADRFASDGAPLPLQAAARFAMGSVAAAARLARRGRA